MLQKHEFNVMMEEEGGREKDPFYFNDCFF